jgi:hypothetical protein
MSVEAFGLKVSGIHANANPAPLPEDLTLLEDAVGETGELNAIRVPGPYRE